ncbi:MAG: Trm112 family protein [Aquificota bacterium]|nr:MAG: Trm112 family protein [Aquificota bacterium]
MISKEFLEILACPECKGEVVYIESENCFVCGRCLLKYPVVEDIPDFLVEDAEKITEEEFKRLLGEKERDAQ